MTATDTYLLLRAFCDELARCGLRARLHLARLALHADRAVARSRAADPLLVAHRRALRRLLRARRCEGVGPAGGGHLHVRDRRGQPRSGGDRGVLEARVPLIVLTADRPPELRDVGAGQTIDQLKLYGDAVKWFFEVGVHDATPERLRWIRTLACRAYWTALDGPPGPVHLNFPLREPLVLGDQPLPADLSGRPGGRPWVMRAAATPSPPANPSRAPAAWRRRGRAGRARSAAGGGGGGVRRTRRLSAARRPALGRAPRSGGDRPLRPAAARPAVRRRAPAAARDPRRRPADLQAAARLARGARRRRSGRARPARQLAGSRRRPVGHRCQRPCPRPRNLGAGDRDRSGLARPVAGRRRRRRRRDRYRARRRALRAARRAEPRRVAAGRGHSVRRLLDADPRRRAVLRARTSSPPACSPTAAPTGSTARLRARSAPRPSAMAPSSC